MVSQPFGLYIHVPFCAGKCPYCDFYSLPPSGDIIARYTARLRELLSQWGAQCSRPVTSVYFGGGTPSLLGAGTLSSLLEAVGRSFSLAPEAEITCEVNPTGVDREFFAQLRAGGFNRLSMGLQSANREELALLGRRHSAAQAAEGVWAARAGGFSNLSLDLMLALPGSNQESLGRSIAFAAGLNPEHISAYLLKVEPGTPFAQRELSLPDEDETAGQYLFCVEELARLGYAQYEISNFARPGFESRHNLLYWQCQEYLGLGPAAHSFWEGRRFHWPRDLEGFLQGNPPEEDGPGGDWEEFAMLNLRLVRGLTLEDAIARYPRQGAALFRRTEERARRCPPSLLRLEPGRLALTPEGFLVSNGVLAQIL